MIDPRELRIGNYVYSILQSGIYEVVGIKDNGEIWAKGDHSYWSAYGCNHIDPISITEELLIKAGFEPEEKEIFEIVSGVKYGFEYIYKYFNFSIGKIYNNSNHWAWFNAKGLIEVNYFHHLQNIIFDLSGKELKI